MAINIVEEVIIPEVPRIIDSQQIYVYVPTATTGTPGIASFDGNQFIVVDGKVNIKDVYIEKYNTNNIPDYVQYSANGIKTPNVWYYNNNGAILVTYKEGVQSEFDVTNNRFRELTIVGGVVTVVGSWRSIFDDLGNINDDLNSIFNTLDTKVDKIDGKGLSDINYTQGEKDKLENKVDKIDGMGLSDRNYTQVEKDKLENIEANAQVNTVLGVKGHEEFAYRTGSINLTPSNIGAATPDDVNTAMTNAVNEAGQYTDERYADAKEYTDDETTRANKAEVALSARIDAQEGLGGMLSAHDFGTDTPYDAENDVVLIDLITPYALSQIPSINNDETKIWNGTKVSNLFDGRTWQLTNTQNTTPVVFEWINIGATFMAKATNDTLGVGKGSDTVKVNAGGEFYTSTTLIGAATEGQFEVLDTQVSKAVTDVKTAISSMEATLGLAALWDAEGENELLDAEGENLLSVAHIDANSINGREFYVMSKAEHAALVSAGTYIPDAFYLTF